MSDDKYKSVFADNLNKLMRIKGITQTDIINDLKINKSTISTWCNGSRLPRMDKVQLIADYLGVSKSDLIEEKETKEEAINCNNIYKLDKIKLPMLGKVACGEPIFADEDTNSYQMFIIKDQSLKGLGIEENDIIFYKEIGFVKNNELAVIKINDQLAVRRYVHYDIGLTVFRAENPTYKDISYKDNDMSISVQVVGKVMAFERILTK